MFAVCDSYKIKTPAYMLDDMLESSKDYKAYPAMVAQMFG